MNDYISKNRVLIRHLLILVLLTLFAVWMKKIDIRTTYQESGLINFSFGFILLFAYAFSRVLRIFNLPLITGYIFAGIIAGPSLSGFLSAEMLQKFRFIDDLALSYIAMNAGGELKLNSLKNRKNAIIMNIFLQVTIIFSVIYVFIRFGSDYFAFTKVLLPVQVSALAILLGVIAIARSPASTIAIINETNASGNFTDTVLGVTVIKDVLIIIFFTIALSITKITITGDGTIDYHLFLVLSGEILAAIFIGVLLGKAISHYILKIGQDNIVFLILFGFGITKLSLWFSGFSESCLQLSIHLEPLLICISTGFTIQNFSKAGPIFMESLHKIALPIYILFFSLAGANLNLEALKLCWPLAALYVVFRIGGIFISTYLAGRINKDPVSHNQVAWMAYITQAGVAIGLAQLAGRQFPEIGNYLITVVLAVTTINQIIGPVLFKKSLQVVGEVKE